MSLAPYASHERYSRGRRYREPPPDLRGEYQRDRDRIIHSTSFRRLEYKTQVFVNHQGDLYRTRLTHSLEVAQIGRTISRIMGLHEDLTEAIALAHDLGHAPFGHAGQEALNACLKDYGGFEHNLQSLRVVDELEERYAEFRGLNLTFETREGILKHCSPVHATALGTLGRRFLEGGQPSLEAQVANLADEIAYNCHDVDDGLRSGLITLGQLQEVALFRVPYEEVGSLYPNLSERRIIHEVVRRMINRQVVDLVEASLEWLEQANPREADEVRRRTGPLIGFSSTMAAQNRELKHFLHTALYGHYLIHRTSVKVGRLIGALFEAFIADPYLLPPQTLAILREREASDGAAGRAQAVADYIAGMTDRYAIVEHQRVLDPSV
ncbi:Deoxyguanosinetriphosphate triphosphohydrolase-like protein [Gammaproteobacteria bacterium]